MNEIRVKRMVLGGLAMFVVWIATALLVEHFIGRVLLGYRVEAHWPNVGHLAEWGALNHLLNLVLPLLNSTILIWLYASLRPMYGVGTRTALITSAFGVVLLVSLSINMINIGLIPARAGLIEAVFELIEFPVAMIVGASVYEGTREETRV